MAIPLVSRRLLLLLVVAVAALAACTDDNADPPVNVGTPLPRPAAIDCGVPPTDPPDVWPVAVPSALTATRFDVDERTYTLSGVTGDAAALLAQLFDDTLADYDVVEVEDDDVALEFSRGDAFGTLVFTTPGEEVAAGCSAVDLTVAFNGPAPIDQFVAVEALPSDGAAPFPPPADPVGSGTVTTGRGAYPVQASVCRLDPAQIVAVAPDGQLIIEERDGRLELSWTYLDGAVVSDSDATTIARDTSSLFAAGDGENEAGPETILAEIRCDESTPTTTP
ncbi:MAG: hypothetical protein AAF547_00320 [Actinomycetota bacterium]